MKKVFGIKVGSNLVTDGKGSINVEFLLALCQQVVEIFRQGNAAFIVSSGAIASEPDKSMSLNLRAVIGQPIQMNTYIELFKIFGFKCGQLEITDNDLKGDVLKRVLLEAFEKNIILILNANDGTDNKEIESLSECADNDQLIKNVALMLKGVMSGVIIGFGKPGIIDDAGEIVRLVYKGEKENVLRYAKGGSELGHGENGAYTKFMVAGELAENGIPTILAPGADKDFVKKSIRNLFKLGAHDFGTTFSPVRRKVW